MRLPKSRRDLYKSVHSFCKSGLTYELLCPFATYFDLWDFYKSNKSPCHFTDVATFIAIALAVVLVQAASSGPELVARMP